MRLGRKLLQVILCLLLDAGLKHDGQFAWSSDGMYLAIFYRPTDWSKAQVTAPSIFV
jgi:hypothetical protein